jgi:hypothetical protein
LSFAGGGLSDISGPQHTKRGNVTDNRTPASQEMIYIFDEFIGRLRIRHRRFGNGGGLPAKSAKMIKEDTL